MGMKGIPWTTIEQVTSQLQEEALLDILIVVSVETYQLWAVLGLRNEIINKKSSFNTFREKLMNYVLTNLQNAEDARDAKLWSKEKVKSLFPSIFITPALPNTHPAMTPLNTDTETNTTLIATLLVELQKSWESKSTFDDEEKKEDDPSTAKVSTFEKSLLKTMHGLPQNCNDNILPTWYLHLFRKHQDDKDQDHINAKTLNGPQGSKMQKFQFTKN